MTEQLFFQLKRLVPSADLKVLRSSSTLPSKVDKFFGPKNIEGNRNSHKKQNRWKNWTVLLEFTDYKEIENLLRFLLKVFALTIAIETKLVMFN